MVRYNTIVSFVVSGRDEPVVESACVQLWIPKQLDGQPVKFGQSTSRGPWDSSHTEGISTPNSILSPMEPAVRGRSIPTPPMALGARLPMAIPRRPIELGSRQIDAASSSGSESSILFPGPWQSRSSSVSTANTDLGSIFSLSSNFSTTTSVSNSNFNGGKARTADFHQIPPKPMLVLFTQNTKTGKLAMVTVDIDKGTEVNPDRCNCRRSGRDGSSCQIAAVEQDRGELLSVRRFEGGDGDADWNLARLALSRRSESEYAAAAWKDVRRISIMFPTSEDRAKFGGMPNICICSARTESELGQCLKKRHKGYLGLVREFGRQQSNEYHRWARHSSHIARASSQPHDLKEEEQIPDLEDEHLDEDANLAHYDDLVSKHTSFTNKSSKISKSDRKFNSPKLDRIARTVRESLQYTRQRDCGNCLPDLAYTQPRLNLCQNHTHPFSIIINTDWKPLEYLDAQFGGQSLKIGSVLTYTGLVSSAFATTCSEYLRATWPHSGQELLDTLEKVIQAARLHGFSKEAQVSSAPKGTSVNLFHIECTTSQT